MGWLPDYQPVFHAITQIQGFLMSFAVGFLFTMIPRRANCEPPAWWQLSLVAVLLPATSVAAWYSKLAVSQLCWFGVVGVLAAYLAKAARSGGAPRLAVPAFVWIPISLTLGVTGSLMTATAAVMTEEYFWVHQLGQMLVLQGMFLGLVLGLGRLVLPLLTRGAVLPEARRPWIALAGHLTAAALLVASFWLEVVHGPRPGYALRAAVVACVLLVSGEIWRRPDVAGVQRRLAWAAAWLVPAGYLFGALVPAAKKAGLHVTLIGGFALMAFSVGLHVILSHGPRNVENRTGVGDRWRIPLFGGLLLVAAALRTLVDLDPERFYFWIGASASAFLAGTLVWAWVVVPRLGPRLS